jgi:hypothetical protein
MSLFAALLALITLFAIQAGSAELSSQLLQQKEGAM